MIDIRFVKLDKPVLLVFLLTFLSELSMLGCWSATREAECEEEGGKSWMDELVRFGFR